MPVRSLVELATAACVKNIHELESVGDYLPYDNVRSILLKVDNAHQLRQIELNSPQIDGETGEIWLRLIERDFPLEYKSKAYKPQNPTKWYRVWEKYKRDHDRALQESEKKLKNALAGLQEVKEKNVSKIVERKYLPREARKMPKRALLARRDGPGSTLKFTGGSRTKTMNGASVMRKVRREVKEIASIHGSLSRVIRGPARLTQVSKAPASMVHDYQRAAQPAYRPTPRVAERSSIVTEHEKRATFISDSEDDDADDLFDESDDEPAPKPTRKPVQNPALGSATAASLLKKRPITTSPKPPVKVVVAPRMPRNAEPKTPTTPAATTRRSSGILSNSYKPSASAAVAVAPTTKQQPKAASKPPPVEEPRPSQYLPRTQTSPPLPPSAGPSSPPPYPQLPAAGPDVQARKRKAVDIFMRPKKKTSRGGLGDVPGHPA